MLCLFVGMACFAGRASFAADAPRITELMAANDLVLADEDGDFPDWIEIHNPASTVVSLAGYFLTDDAQNLRKWRFPNVTIQAGGFLVVFASNKDRDGVPGELHTNFELSADGEFLALVAPDGETAVSVFAPAFPPLLENESYGIGPGGSIGTVSLAPTWSFPGNYANVYVAGGQTASETAGSKNVDLGTGGPNSQAYVWMDFSSRLAQLPVGTKVASANLIWRGTASASVIGVPTVSSRLGVFRVPDSRHGIATVAATFTGRDVMDYYAANSPVAEITAAPGQSITANWNLADLVQEWIDQPGMAQRGQIMILNSSRPVSVDWEADASRRPRATLNVATAGDPNAPLVLGFFASPTPGAANASGRRAGPIILPLPKNPPQPEVGPLLIQAEVTPANDPVASVRLYYRRMFTAEVMSEMRNDGTGGDRHAGDGVWSAVIPAAALAPGQMTRWRFVAVDASGTETKEPAYRETGDSHQYYGTVARDPAIKTLLPVFHWFTLNTTAPGTAGGARGAVYYDGEFYDNVLFNLHGQSSQTFPKKSFNVDFNRTQRFRWSTNAPRVADIDLLTNWGDKSKVRHVLAYEIMRESGVAAHFAFTVRVQQNGKFFSTADLVEDADEIYLERAGLNPEGALYKIYMNQLNRDAGDTATTGLEKKTRQFEANTDLQALINGLDLTGTALATFLYDNIDIPACVNLLAANSVIRNIDMNRKNWYLYRDTGRTDEWAILPWDLDLSHGRGWDSVNTYFDNALYTDGLIQTGTARLPTSLFGNSAIRSMILRRIRTLIDEFLQPPPAAGTPESALYYERRLNEQLALLDPPDIVPSDAQLDFQKWGSWLQAGRTVPYTHTNAAVETMAEAIARFKTVYLRGRRNYIYNTQVVGRGGAIPLAQQQPLISFGRIEPSPASGNQDEEFIQLQNTNSVAVDISEWKLAGGVEHTFAPGTVIPARGALYVSPDAAAFRRRSVSPKGREGLFVQGGYRGHLSSFGETIVLLDHTGATNNAGSYEGEPSDAQRSLVISEVMYHPRDELAEFIEVLNISTSADVNLEGVRFTEGVQFDFTGSDVRTLAPGERVLVVRDRAAFEAVYGKNPRVAGAFTNGTALNNGGETIKLEDAQNGTIREFEYDDQAPWPQPADGGGYSLVLIAPQSNPDHALAQNWRISARPGGTPAGTDVPAFPSEPAGDNNANGEADLLDYVLGNDLGGTELAPEFVTMSDPATGISELYLRCPRSIAAEGARLSFLFSTDLTTWESGSANLEAYSSQLTGDGRELLTWRVKPPLRDSHEIFMRLQAHQN